MPLMILARLLRAIVGRAIGALATVRPVGTRRAVATGFAIAALAPEAILAVALILPLRLAALPVALAPVRTAAGLDDARI